MEGGEDVVSDGTTADVDPAKAESGEAAVKPVFPPVVTWDETVVETRVSALASGDSRPVHVVELCRYTDVVLASVFSPDELSADRSVVNTAGLDQDMRLLFRAGSSVTGVEASE